MILNAVSVLLPLRWIESVLVWCGVGSIPNAVLFQYLLRGSGFLLISIGVLIWVIAGDVVRYRPLVITIICIFLAGAPVSLWIDVLVGLPRWWCVLDVTICLVGGGLPLLLCVWPIKRTPDS